MKKNLCFLVLTLTAFSFTLANAARLNLSCNDVNGKEVASLTLDANDKLLSLPPLSSGEFRKNFETYKPALVSFRFIGLDEIFSDHSLDLKKVMTNKDAVEADLSLAELKPNEDREGLDLKLDTEFMEEGEGPYADEVYQQAQLTVHNFADLGYQWVRRSRNNSIKRISTVNVDANETFFATLSYDEGGMGYGGELKLLCVSEKSRER